MSAGMVDVLENKRDAMRFRILVEIADRQPAVRQGEIAESVGVTSQAVSEYIRELVADGYVEREGRSRYAVTKEGVDWLLRSAADVKQFAEHVTDDVLGTVHTDAAIAADTISAGDQVSLFLDGGLLNAVTKADGGATGRASNNAAPGEVVGVTSFEGIIELEPGHVEILQIPSIRTDVERIIDYDRLREAGTATDLILCTGVEAVVAARQAELTPGTWFAPGAVAADAAGRGLDVAIVATLDHVGRVIDALSDAGIRHEVTDMGP